MPVPPAHAALVRSHDDDCWLCHLAVPRIRHTIADKPWGKTMTDGQMKDTLLGYGLTVLHINPQLAPAPTRA
jgi:hypothetical protein